MRVLPRILLPGLFACATALPSVVIHENTPRRLVFTFTLDRFDTATVMIDGRPQTVIQAPEANTEYDEPGTPVLPARAFHVGIPSAGDISVTCTADETAAMTLASPLQTRAVEVAGYAFRPGLSFDGPWLSRPQVSVMGRYRAAYLMLKLFRYDANSRRLDVLRKATVTVSFPPSVSTGAAAPSAFNDAALRLMLNAPVARTWALPRPAASLRKRAATHPLSPGRAMMNFRIGDGTSGINEGMTLENGVIRLSGADLRAQWGSDLRFERLALYGSTKSEVDSSIPELDSIPPGIVRIPLFPVDRDRDGVVDADEYALACVSGTSDWEFDPALRDYRFRLNRFEDFRTYWLVRESSPQPQMARASQPPGAVRTERGHWRRLNVKRSRKFPTDSREGTVDWVWEKLTGSVPAISHDVPVTGRDGDSLVHFTVYYDGLAYGSRVKAAAGGTTICSPCTSGVQTSVDEWGGNPVEVRIHGTGDTSEVDRFEVTYRQKLELTGAVTSLDVFSPTDTALVEYELRLPSSGMVWVFRVPADESQTRLVDSVRADGGTFTWSDTAGVGVRYRIASEAGLLGTPSPQSVSAAATGSHSIRDLHATTNRAHYLVIHPAEFGDAAAALAAHKEAAGLFDHASTVAVEEIYREFSGGNVDPAAIRNFLFYAKHYWDDGDRLSYVVLLGDGHWDYKHVVSQKSSWIPPPQLGTGRSEICYEDYYAMLSPGEHIDNAFDADVFVGRLPAASASEAQTMVDKIVALEESGADWGAWRNRMVLIADDDRQGSRPDPIGGSSAHYLASELMDQVVSAGWPAIDMRKIYLFEYEANEQFEKPAVTQAIVNLVNNGVGCINYFGHGAHDVWADEHIVMNDDVVKMQNTGRYPMINSFSCSVGKFDDPRLASLSALLVRHAGGGAISAISSSREAWAGTNMEMGRAYYTLLFDTLACRSLGQAYFETKAAQRKRTLRSYCILGDPSICMVRPVRTVRMTVHDEQGREQDTLKALQKVVIRGSVRNRDGGAIDNAFGTESSPAYTQVSLFHPAYTTTRKDGYPDDGVRYVLPGLPIFIGVTPVRAGRFEQTVLLPRNVPFNQTGAKLTAYAWQAGAAALGHDTSLVFAGTDSSMAQDSAGPSISLRPVYDNAGKNSEASFTDMITGTLPMTFEIVVFDESGIDVMGVGPSEGLTMEMPGVLSRRNINYAFQFTEGDFRRGSASYTFAEGQIAEGRYALKVSAQDLVGNVSCGEFSLEIVPETELKLNHVFNYPNPVRMGEQTRFFFYASNTAENWNGIKADVTIKIYTLSGKLIRLIRPERNGQEWDLTDQFGTVLGPNVYLYQVVARVSGYDVKSVKSPIRKLVIHPPGR